MADATPILEAGTPGRETGQARLDLEIAILAGRLALLLDRLAADDDGRLAALGHFLRQTWRSGASGCPPPAAAGGPLSRRPVGAVGPFDRLARQLDLSEIEAELLLLAAAAEEHEGFADTFQALHPSGRARPTAALAADLLAPDRDARLELQAALLTGAAARAGALALEDDEPFWRKSLVIGDALWPVLRGIDAWPGAFRPLAVPGATDGLGSWLGQEATKRARHALEVDLPAVVAVVADAPDVAFGRAGALVDASGRTALGLRWSPGTPPGLARLLVLHVTTRGAVPVLLLPDEDAPERRSLAGAFASAPVVVVAGRAGAHVPVPERPLFEVPCTTLTWHDGARMWQRMLPHLAEQAGELAARFPIEPARAHEVRLDLTQIRTLERWPPSVSDVARSVRARAATDVGRGAKLVRPQAGWDQLVLPAERLAQLKEAVSRLMHQGVVLDDWRFLAGRHGSRGVRMLFAGPPGTGKTLAAEVVAGAIGVDLVVVDLARVVSKWIGETEKNLAEVFDAAERARSVLFFDEADALFGRRTEVSDAHDRYANLETAYLLTRLERFQGLAVLATNLRQNIDPAFLRRLEFIVEFEEPGRIEREALWRCHLPPEAPLAEDVDLAALAALYPVTGALIRNAAVAAAFVAAAEGGPITAGHFARAIRREYEKAGKAFRDLPAPASGPKRR